MSHPVERKWLRKQEGKIFLWSAERYAMFFILTVT